MDNDETRRTYEEAEEEMREDSRKAAGAGAAVGGVTGAVVGGIIAGPLGAALGGSAGAAYVGGAEAAIGSIQGSSPDDPSAGDASVRNEAASDQMTNPDTHLTGTATSPDLTDESLTGDEITDLQTGRPLSDEADLR